MKELTTYLIFDGNCREAMTFYKRCLDADLHIMSFSDVKGQVDFPEEAKDLVMHARLAKGPAALMASDTMPGMPHQQGSNFSVSINCESLEEVERVFAALSEKGQVKMPLQEVFWGARFGMLTDQFGVGWMLIFEHPKQG